MTVSEILYIFLIAAVATAAMTTFSYVMTRKKEKQFREPELLNDLISGSTTFHLQVSKENILGWVAHFAIGVAFTVLFWLLCTWNILDIGVLSALIFGVAAGLTGIASWHLMFFLNENPPDIPLKDFSLQLMIAHVIFAAFVVGGFYVAFVEII